jgi:diguanylate cyclase (GGDEF)-like protein
MSGSILIIDDADSVRSQIMGALRNEGLFGDYREARDGIDGFKSLIASKPDLVICDLEMPRMDGFKFLQMVNSREELKDIPIIMLTGRDERELKIKGLNFGACDYLTKPFDIGELVARVKVQLKVKALQDDLKRSNELLRELSDTDPLTRLHNRRYLTKFLDCELTRTMRTGERLSLIMLDIDNFKKVNDTYGHQNGDTVLSAVADAIRKGRRCYDIAARYGGEEFVILLPGTSLRGGITVAEQLRSIVQAIYFEPPLDKLAITISAGVSAFPAACVDDADSLIKEADKALYRAKKNGRNRVEAMGTDQV